MVADVLGLDPETLGEWALAVATVLGGAAALLVVGEWLRRWYRRTLGRRRDRYERLARLGTQAQLSFLESVLGEPPAMRRTLDHEVEEYDPVAEEMLPVERSFIECFFIDRDYYVQVVCNEEETVIAFSVTTRSRRFRPRFSFPARPGWRGRRRFKDITGQRFRPFFDIELGKSRFNALDASRSRPMRRAEMGARTFSYTELFYYGNPGHYQHFGFTASVAATHGPIGRIGDVVNRIGRDWTGGVGEEGPDAGEIPELSRFRHETVITTYTVVGPHIRPENYPTPFGPHGDEVRTLP